MARLPENGSHQGCDLSATALEIFRNWAREASSMTEFLSYCESRNCGTGAMSVDTGSVFKRSLHCLECEEAFYFTLRAIAESEKLACPHCGRYMDLAEEAYRRVVAEVKATIGSLMLSGCDAYYRSSSASRRAGKAVHTDLGRRQDAT
jgi:DNA-directed RNA polymerase subunit RPC12/RpoP